MLNNIKSNSSRKKISVYRKELDLERQFFPDKSVPNTMCKYPVYEMIDKVCCAAETPLSFCRTNTVKNADSAMNSL